MALSGTKTVNQKKVMIYRPNRPGCLRRPVTITLPFLPQAPDISVSFLFIAERLAQRLL